MGQVAAAEKCTAGVVGVRSTAERPQGSEASEQGKFAGIEGHFPC